jgi:16S rRNA (adenine1518-N6/adenine1519-N6)-dimethyltransferase
MFEGIKTKKSLGQHWLKDEESLKEIVDAASITKRDTVLEVGPGLGAMTKHLVKKARKVIAVEVDEVLARRLSSEVAANNLIVRNQDILRFDLGELPPKYKVVANIPYYLTGNLLRLLSDSNNPPSQMALLLQKEVAVRLAAKPGEMSIISSAVQLEYEVSLGKVIEAKLFTPAPKVDSQIVKLTKRENPLFKGLDKNSYMRIVKAGFSSPRKKLRSSLSAGLGLDKNKADELLKKAKINSNLRAQNLSLQDWHKIYKSVDDI